jgi:hypothetical protein
MPRLACQAPGNARIPGQLRVLFGRPLGFKSFVENSGGRIDCDHVSGLLPWHHDPWPGWVPRSSPKQSGGQRERSRHTAPIGDGATLSGGVWCGFSDTFGLAIPSRFETKARSPKGRAFENGPSLSPTATPLRDRHTRPGERAWARFRGVRIGATPLRRGGPGMRGK